jgi:segregation and condensation protein A
MALGELQISWVGSDEGEILVTDEFDIPVVLENETEEVNNV